MEKLVSIEEMNPWSYNLKNPKKVVKYFLRDKNNNIIDVGNKTFYTRKGTLIQVIKSSLKYGVLRSFGYRTSSAERKKIIDEYYDMLIELGEIRIDSIE